MQLVDLWSQQTRRLAQANAAALDVSKEADKVVEAIETGVSNEAIPGYDETPARTPATAVPAKKEETAAAAVALISASASAVAAVAVGATPSPSNPLELVVSSGGGNLSVGERQLLCLARALVRGAKVLVMDEATANVDPSTDERIQRVIQRELGHATVITVAHRLATVIYYDLVLVLSEGRSLEFGSPAQLLAKPDGHFRALCARTGDLAVLEAEATKAAEAHKNI